MSNSTFIKIVCEQVSPFAKEILVDKNCKDINEACCVLQEYSELMEQNNTWVLYPMSVKFDTY